ncbi:MAG: multi-sensor hybrid histidine kinase, partial [Frankiales bacterium]|nr:multi-sensor hybrid histidine kinase [Frankiales bacterium]
MPHGLLDHVSAPRPHDEAARLDVLRSFQVMDTPREQRYDAIVRLASQVTDMPVAGISLVDDQRQWFKAATGTDLLGTSRDVAFCAHALLQPDDLLVVPDALLDDRFATNPLVTGPPGLRAYAGAPLVGSDAQPLGTLCVLDVEPRVLGDRQLEALRTLSQQVVAQLERERAERRLAEAERARRDADARFQDTQHRLSEALQSAGDQVEAHQLLRGHLQRTIPDSVVHILNRNNSADRLEASTALADDSPLAEALVTAEPRSCIAVRLSRPFERSAASPEVLECELCGKLPGETSCRPLLVGG